MPNNMNILSSSGPSPSLIRMFIRSKPERDETAPRIASAAQSPRACAADAIRFRRAVSVSPAWRVSPTWAESRSSAWQRTVQRRKEVLLQGFPLFVGQNMIHIRHGIFPFPFGMAVVYSGSDGWHDIARIYFSLTFQLPPLNSAAYTLIGNS